MQSKLGGPLVVTSTAFPQVLERDRELQKDCIILNVCILHSVLLQGRSRRALSGSHLGFLRLFSLFMKYMKVFIVWRPNQLAIHRQGLEELLPVQSSMCCLCAYLCGTNPLQYFVFIAYSLNDVSTEIKVIESGFCEADIGLKCIEVTKLMLSSEGLYCQIFATTAILLLNWYPKSRRFCFLNMGKIYV